LPPFFRFFDANQDGSLEVKEVAQVPVFLAALDKNNDQQITAAEFCPNQAAGTGVRGNASEGFLRPCLSLFDKDENGILSNAEIKESANVLAALDKNNDLKLTVDELCTGRGFAVPRCGNGHGTPRSRRGNGFCGGGNPNCPCGRLANKQRSVDGFKETRYLRVFLFLFRKGFSREEERPREFIVEKHRSRY